MKDKSKCTPEAFLRWEEVRDKSIEPNHNIILLSSQKNGLELPDDLKKFYEMSDGIEIRWAAKMGNNSKHIFNLNTDIVIIFIDFVMLKVYYQYILVKCI